MIKYKKIVASNGRELFYKNGKLVSASEIPTEIVPRLEDGVELSLSSPNPETVDQTTVNKPQLSASENECIFCQEQATRRKFVNQELTFLCDEDYNKHTLGQVAAQMRKVKE